MRTKKQQAASRRNARHSTGPKTPAGKAASSMNGLRHGLRARTAILPGENQEDFDEISIALQNQYQPQNPTEQHLVDQAANAQWKLLRAENYEAEAAKDHPSIDDRIATFSRMTLATGRLERSFNKACRELERLRAAREAPAEQPEKMQKSQKSKKLPEPEPPAAISLFWVDPETGERTLAAQTPEAVELSRRRQAASQLTSGEHPAAE
jgi:hypothetical protein